MTAKINTSDDGDAKPEDREDTEYSYPALKLHQNGHVIYYTTIPIDDLFPFSCVERFNERTYFGAMFELFDDVVRKAKKELNSVKLPALQTVVSLFSDIAESDYSGPAKRQRLIEEMRNRLHSDTSIDPEDI